MLYEVVLFLFIGGMLRLGRVPRAFSFFSLPGTQDRACSILLNRMQSWDDIKEKRKGSIVPQEITVQFPGLKIVKAPSHETTLHQIINQQSDITENDQKEHIVAAEVDGRVMELFAPLQKDTVVSKWIPFHSVAGSEIFWHSSAHLLGYALEQLHAEDYNPWQTKGLPSRIKGKQIYLDDGPALKSGGFFYDFIATARETSNSEAPSTINKQEMKRIQKWMTYLMNKNEEFERMELTKEEALKLFNYNPLKTKIIRAIPEDQIISCYRVGHFIDLCKGPHVPSTGFLKLLNLTASSTVENQHDYFGDVPMQRVSGITFPDLPSKEVWEKQQKDAKLYDHRTVGKKQQLFMSHPYSPGSPFFLPHGVTLITRLQNYLNKEYKRRGYKQVITPNIFTTELWKTSGHWDNYKENLFTVTSNHGMFPEGEEKKTDGEKEKEKEKEHFCLKPMNCPAHCLIFENESRSYKDLPIRLAEYGVLHRDELAGALTGLTRVRRFVQDDAHIFCTTKQIGQEVAGCLEFVQKVYGMFNFEFSLSLSTKPKKAIGSAEQWEYAENQLKDTLNQSGMPWNINEGDGAFYGPKIDITITDVYRREHQCATIQLDFQLPQRFKLSYIGSDDNKHTPIMIHRAVLGSFERFIAMLTEHTHGRWPFWLSPRQCMVCSVTDSAKDYSEDIVKRLEEKEFTVEASLSDWSISKKIREASQLHFNFILIIGDKEKENNLVSYRERGSFDMHETTMEKFEQMLLKKAEEFQ